MSIKVFGITGTNGKTTTSYMLKSILEAEGAGCSLIGTISHKIGKDEYQAVNTTPGEALLEKYFETMEEQKIPYCVMEISSHGLAQGRVNHIPIHYGGFSNLTRDHLDYHGTLEAYYQAKKKLFYMTAEGHVINLDDSYGARLAQELMEIPDRAAITATLSLKDQDADYYAEVTEETLEGSRIRVWEVQQEAIRLTVPMPGRFSVYNALLALAMARTAGIGFDQIKKGIDTFQGVPGRFERIYSETGGLVVVDYAHTPDALENLLKTIKERKEPRGRLITVFGCGGNRDTEKRQMMGRIAGEYSDYVVITSDNPRNEDPEDIAAAIEEGLYDTGCQYHIMIQREQAIKWAVSILKKGDIIVVAGKGHETGQVIGTEKRPFNDTALIKELI